LRRETRVTALPPIILGGPSDSIGSAYLKNTALSSVQKGGNIE